MTKQPTETTPVFHDAELGRALALEREAQQFHSAGEIEKAFSAYDKSAEAYRQIGEHLKAAMCFAAAATCWNIHTGLQPLRNAASRSQEAAREALAAGHYDYASSLFKDAALLYEKEGDYDCCSACTVACQKARRVHAFELAFQGASGSGFQDGHLKWSERLRHFRSGVLNLLNELLWGYGERPFQMLRIMLCVIVFSAGVYTFWGHLILTAGPSRAISFLEGLYLSVITFATVGYGDYLPLGWLRAVAMGEALSGIILMPLFLVSLTRRYLRMT
ncbi:MAG: potassium channel family protein [Candidatus Omnitrophota bacterium]|jgi:tetratricopeptide (TPR) repeat protein